MSLPESTARFPDAPPNDAKTVLADPVSTFSLDVDTASYAVVRHFLRMGVAPPPAAVRVEEMVNYFPYAYPAPADTRRPFQATATIMPTPWNPDTQLLHIGIRAYDVARATRPRANLVLLLDISGSMAPNDRLPLLQTAFEQFVADMRDDDTIGIVTYAQSARVVLEPTSGRDKAKIIAAIDSLHAEGGTNGAEALQKAYALAERNFDRAAVNRIVLATDGDFNIGITNPKRLQDYVSGKRKTGIYLTVLGVGLDNLNDGLMQRLAQSGNGNAGYVDSLLEARKILADQVASTLFPVADDVKVQIEFNPDRVREYRLIGYETRMLARRDFNNDRVDAGEVGSGHTVTALYEIVPTGSKGSLVDSLRYQPAKPAAQPASGFRDEYAFLRIRYKPPGQSRSQLMQFPIRDSDVVARLDAASADLRFAAAVAAFGQQLRGEAAIGDFGLADTAALAESARGSDPDGYRAEFVQLVRAAGGLKTATMRKSLR